MAHNNEMLVRQAKAVLDFNWTGEYTMPGPRLYPHQWSWDSALIAIGYAHYAPERAIRELTHMFESQWKNGMLPQIVFNPDFHHYFPGSDFWNADESPNAPDAHETSGVVLPPVHATAALHLHEVVATEATEEFLRYAFPKLASWHDYLYTERDPSGEGLAYIRHPWESGMDNSPMWDGILQKMQLREGEVPDYRRVDTHTVSAEDRPASAAYDRFAYLVRLFSSLGYDEKRIREECPFLVQDVLFNSLLCRSGQDLAEIARILGEDPEPHEARAAKTARAIEEKLWDEEHGIYLDYDLLEDRPIHVYFAPNFAPLFAGVPDEKQAARMVDTMENSGFGLADDGVAPIPTYDLRGFGFSPTQYWRGPVWININWFLMHGLARYGHEKEATRLRDSIVDLCRDTGFHEYFNPTTRRGHGSMLFSWSAALLLDALYTPLSEDLPPG